MTLSSPDQNNTIFYEMMSHPALFTHPHPLKVAIIGDEEGRILQEVIKHHHLNHITYVTTQNTIAPETSAKVHHCELNKWLKKVEPQSLDVIIHAGQPHVELLTRFFALLTHDGILIQQSNSPFDVKANKKIAHQLQEAGFHHQQILNFPQPSYTLGWRSIIMSTKRQGFKRVREKAVFTKPFKTYYYNLDTHKASLVLPEFMREEWVV